MKRTNLLWIVSAILLLHPSASAKVWINEFMQSNIDCLVDDKWEFPDSWVELYNDGDNSQNISGWYLSETAIFREGWKLPDNTVIPAKGYLLVYCDKVAIGLHTHYRLESGKGCSIYLFNDFGVEIDKVVSFPKQPAPNIAAGRLSDAAEEWGYFVKATPGEKNVGTTSPVVLPAPLFSIPGGVFKEAITVSLSLPELVPDGVDITHLYYTLDGSEPTTESLQYSGAIQISATTPIRAKLIHPNYLPNRSTTHSYIITDRELTLPVVSLVLDPAYLWDKEFGIYVTGNQSAGNPNYENKWRRPMNIEYFPKADEAAVFNQIEEMRISGKYSRRYPQKSLICYANKRFGEKQYDYQLFDSKPNQTIKSFVLRNSGNDFYNMSFRDAAIQLFMGRKVDIDYQEYQPSILFLNGEYYGIMNIRERSDEDFVIANYDGLEDIDMIENWGGELKAGDKVAYNDMIKKLYYEDDKIPHEELMGMVDTEEFINYMILQIFVGNTDFPSGNVVLWRPRTEGGKWRFIVKDTDFGLGYANPVDFDALHHNTDLSSFKGDKLLFTKLLDHEPFKEEFYTRFAVYMGDLLRPSNTAFVIDSIKQLVEQEMPYHRKRFLSSDRGMDYWYNLLENKKVWCQERIGHVYNHLSQHFGFEAAIPLQIKMDDEITSNPTLSFNNVPLQKPSFDGRYFREQRVHLLLDGGKEIERCQVEIFF